MTATVWRLLCLGLLLLGVGGGSRAHAQQPRSRVALVRVAVDDPLLRDASLRLRAELTSVGFEVIDVDAAPADPRTEVESAAADRDTFATVALDRTAGSAYADVWVSDHLSGKTVVRRLEVDESAQAPGVLAIRALELLRASLLEVVQPAPSAKDTSLHAPTDVANWVEPTLPSAPQAPSQLLRDATLEVAALALHGSSGLGLAAGPSLRLAHGLVGAWFARVTLAGPLFGPQPSRAEGQASVRQEHFSAELGVSSAAQPIGVHAWAGLGAFHLHASGSAAQPYRSRDAHVLSLLGVVGIGTHARLGARVGLNAELSLIGLTPYPVVVIAGQDVGRAGAPSVGASLGLLVGL